MGKKIVVIGGSAAGPKAAAKARRTDENAEITIIQKSKELSMASCGYPYYVGGFFDDRNMLLSTPTGVVRDQSFYLNAKNIVAKVETEALEINRADKFIVCKSVVTGQLERVPYDKLIIATGANPIKPPIPGIDLDGITTLQNMSDADYLRKIRDEKKITKAVMIGGGLIGIETCEAMRLADIDVTVVELLPQLLTFLDWDLAKLIENHIKSKGVNVITGNGVAEFLGENGKLNAIKLANGTEIPCELAVIATGVRPNSKLAKDAGIEVGVRGGVLVNEFMQTNDKDIYAVGDCLEIKNLITGKLVHAPFGDLANLQGRVAGENAASENKAVFKGTYQTGICKIFDFAAGVTGLTETFAKKEGMDVISVVNSSPDKPGFMNGKLLVTKLVIERLTGKILGAQCVGPGEVSKQVAQWAMALTGGLKLDDLINADLPYAPPFSLAIDHFIATVHIMQNKMKGSFTGISVTDVKKKIDNGETPFILDARGPDEFEQMRLGIGETLIPLGALRKRIHEIPKDKDREIICFCKISLRGYEAAVILKAHGWKNVKVMEGGIMAWPYSREK